MTIPKRRAILNYGCGSEASFATVRRGGVYNQEMIEQMMQMFTNPAFKKGFFDFYVTMQKEGIEAAKKFWKMHPALEGFEMGPEIFEKMTDFYFILGFVPRQKFEDLARENEKLKAEASFLRSTLNEMHASMLNQAGEKAREVWTEIMDKQMEAHKEIAKNFFELFKNIKN